MIIDGKKIAQRIVENLKQKPVPKKFLGVFLIGEDPTSISFIKQKEKLAQELGVDFRCYRFPPEIKQDQLRKEIFQIAKHKTCGGVIVQLPLPAHINKYYVCNPIPREKDVDLLGERALGAFYAGRNPVLPPAVGVVEEILKEIQLEEINKIKAIIIGRGVLIGRPIALWLMDKVSELKVYSRQTENLNEKLKDGDLIISGVGQRGRFRGIDLKEEAIVIDFGYEIEDKKIYGDFIPPNEPSKIKYTPTPGGTGPILVAKIFENFYKLCDLK